MHFLGESVGSTDWVLEMETELEDEVAATVPSLPLSVGGTPMSNIQSDVTSAGDGILLPRQTSPKTMKTNPSSQIPSKYFVFNTFY